MRSYEKSGLTRHQGLSGSREGSYHREDRHGQQRDDRSRQRSQECVVPGCDSTYYNGECHALENHLPWWFSLRLTCFKCGVGGKDTRMLISKHRMCGPEHAGEPQDGFGSEAPILWYQDINIWIEKFYRFIVRIKEIIGVSTDTELTQYMCKTDCKGERHESSEHPVDGVTKFALRRYTNLHGDSSDRYNKLCTRPPNSVVALANWHVALTLLARMSPELRKELHLFE